MTNECIPLYTPGATVTAETTAAVTGKTFVDLSGAMDGGLPKVATAAAAGKVFGVAVRDTASGGRTSVIRAQGVILPVTSGGTLAAGDEVEVGVGGKPVALDAGIAVGRAVDAATADADVFIELY